MDGHDKFEQVWTNYWNLLYSDLDTPNDYPNARPLLAHYTSLENIERILDSERLWLSNPLLMNDLEEVRFGVLNGMEIIRSSKDLHDALDSDSRRSAFFDAIEDAFDEYGNEDVIDLYVICFSVHTKDNSDGILSMWRGYGNQGKGAAIVFDTSKLPVPDETPLTLGGVWYATKEERKEKITQKIISLSEFITANHIPDEYLGAAARELFKRLCLFAVFSKHVGFREENEWRLVYLKDRDQIDHDNKLVFFERYFSFFHGSNGIQPKLKLPIGEFLKSIGATISFSDLIDSIIIGPTAASPLAKRSVERMLKEIGKESLIKKIKSSEIPFRES
jgi:hypothetical protein